MKRPGEGLPGERAAGAEAEAAGEAAAEAPAEAAAEAPAEAAAEAPAARLPRRQALRITAVAGVSLALGGGLAAELLRRARLQRVRATRTRLGTLVTVTVVHPERAAARALVEAAFAEIERLEAVLSRHRPDTPLARLNREGSLEGAPPELIHVLERALEYGALSAGAFDVTVAPLLALHASHFGDASGGAPPPEDRVAEALARVDYRRVRIDGARIAFDQPGMSVTLDGIAKGYVVDGAVATLVAAGAERVIVDAGGDIAADGMEGSGDAWRVAVQDPRGPGSLGLLRLRGEAVASSGDYMQAFTQDRRHHHILDPRTGRSPEHTSAVTVVAPTALDADALSTAAFVMGPAEGLALLDRLDGVEGLLVTKSQERVATRGFGRYAG